MMEIPEGKVSLLDAVPVRCGHITGTFIKYYKISQLIHTQSIAN